MSHQAREPSGNNRGKCGTDLCRFLREPQAPSVDRVALQARPDGHQATGKTAEGKIDPRVSPRARKTTGEQLSQMSRRESENERLRAFFDVKLRDVTITVLPGSGSKKVDEELNPFKPSKRLLRSPTIGTKKETCDGGYSEASLSTLKEVKVITDGGRRYLARRAVEPSSSARYRSQVPGGIEVEENMEEIEDPYSDTEKDAKYYLKGFETEQSH